MNLHNKILTGLAVGAAAGLAAHLTAPEAPWLLRFNEYVADPVGQVFLRMLFMVVVPLVFASIALGVAELGDLRRVGKVGGTALAYFLLSTALSATVGIALVNLAEPGGGLDPGLRDELLQTYGERAREMRAAGAAGFGIQTLVQMVPRNPVQAAATGDMLGVIVFALAFGAALTLLPAERARPMIDWLDALGAVVVKIVEFAMRLAPYGVFGLIFTTTSRFGWELLVQLGAYVAVVLGGLLLYAAVGLSALVRTLGGVSPAAFWKKARATIVTAFSTSSSNATLPTNIAVAERELRIPSHVARFVLPLGATLNMNGTALYEGVTVLFLAQVFGAHLGLREQAIVVVLSVLMAVGAAGVPGGSLPLLMVVLATVGVPPESLALILGVDRILDMCRTVLNTTGDLTAAAFVARVHAGWRPELAGTDRELRPAAQGAAPAPRGAGAAEVPAGAARDASGEGPAGRPPGSRT